MTKAGASRRVRTYLQALTDDELQAELDRRAALRPAVPDQLQEVDTRPIRRICAHVVKDVSENGYSKDGQQYIFEAVMEAVYGKDFFPKWWNKAYRG